MYNKPKESWRRLWLKHRYRSVANVPRAGSRANGRGAQRAHSNAVPGHTGSHAAAPPGGAAPGAPLQRAAQPHRRARRLAGGRCRRRREPCQRDTQSSVECGNMTDGGRRTAGERVPRVHRGPMSLQPVARSGRLKPARDASGGGDSCAARRRREANVRLCAEGGDAQLGSAHQVHALAVVASPLPSLLRWLPLPHARTSLRYSSRVAAGHIHAMTPASQRPCLVPDQLALAHPPTHHRHTPAPPLSTPRRHTRPTAASSSTLGLP